MSHLATAIDLIDHGASVITRNTLRLWKQVHFGVFRPRVDTVTSAIDGRCIAFAFVRPHRSRDVHFCIECTALVVIAAIDGSRHCGVITAIIDIRLIDVAGRKNMCAVCAAEDAVNMDGRCWGHIDDGSGRYSLIIATAIDGLNLTTQQVNNRRE